MARLAISGLGLASGAPPLWRKRSVREITCRPVARGLRRGVAVRHVSLDHLDDGVQ
jgi:hypothetical protein